MTPSPSLARKRRTRDLAVRCPACGREAHAAAVRSPGGWVHAGPMRVRTLLAHADCDLFALSAEFSRAALAGSRLRISTMFPTEGGG